MKSTDLVKKSLDGLSTYKSYGGKSLVANLESADAVIDRLKYTEKIWDRSRSQWILKFLTCSNAKQTLSESSKFTLITISSIRRFWSVSDVQNYHQNRFRVGNKHFSRGAPGLCFN